MEENSENSNLQLAKLFSTKARSIGVPPVPSQETTIPITSQPATQPFTPTTTDSRYAQVIYDARKELGRSSSRNGKQSSQLPSDAEIGAAIDNVLQRSGISFSDIQRADLIIQLKQDLSGWGILQELIDHPQVTDIHCYDFQRVVVQRGKESEETGLRWPSHHAYSSFIDRLLLNLDRSLSTQQHTVDVSLANGIRICAIHESVCGSGGPYLSIRVPRVQSADLEMLSKFGVAPAEIVQYLGGLIRTGLATIIIAGETGTGKTTLLRCLCTQFGKKESIVSVEDTPEVNCQHRYYRCLVSRPSNTEGIGEVSLQEHIMTTLRMTPTRVILGEMRSPFAAEAFLESAQTGHVGLSTIHARNARETLVRLESLLGRAQKAVSIEIIRQQIALAVDVVVWLFREKGTGKPRIGEIIEITHYVEGVIQVRPMFSYKLVGGKPTWNVDSWNSKFEAELSSQGINLSGFPKTLTLDPRGFGSTITFDGGVKRV